MKKEIVPLLLGLLLLIIASVANGAEPTPMEIAAAMQAKYEKISSFQADFLQTSTVGGMRHRSRKGSGTMVIQKPSLLRWDYGTPEVQVLVCDGEEFSLYYASEKQMVVSPARDYLREDVTYNFFSGEGNLTRDFEVSPLAEGELEKGSLAVTLTPKKQHPQVARMQVWVNADTFLVNRLRIEDHLGSVTDLSFFNQVTDEPHPKDYFHFTPPEGTEVIRE